MLRRNLLKSLMTIIPASFLNKNIVANETNEKYRWDKTFRNKDGYPIRTEYSDGRWNEYTYDKNNNMLTHKNSDEYWSEQTYDPNGNMLTYKNSKGHMEEYVRDDKGRILNHIRKGYVC